MIEDGATRREGLRIEVLRAGQMTVRSDRDGVVYTIALDGELDLATAADFERELRRVEASDALSIVLDLSGLRFIDSTGVRILLCAHRRASVDGDRLALLRGPSAVQRVFEITGILDVLPFAD
jgi:anti-sigma B factor antagonist